MITIVQEMAAHFAAREKLLDQVFGPTRFMKTCERLREGRLPSNGLAFSMLDGETLIGTIRLWDVGVGPHHAALMLGPVAVACSYQGLGLGNALIRHALAAAHAADHSAVLLVGDAAYYERFGFREEVTANLWMPGPVEHNRFLGLEFQAGALTNVSGFVLPTGALQPKPELSDLMADFALAA